MNETLLKFILAETPGIIEWAKIVFKKRNPDEPTPTDEEVIAAYKRAFESSLAKDDEWLAMHPEDKPTT